MQIYFHSRLCSYLSGVPILVDGTVVYILISAGQRLIASKIKVFVYIIYVCVLYIYYVYINKHTCMYIFKTN